MLYLSLIFIALGIFFIIYTLLTNSKKIQRVPDSTKTPATPEVFSVENTDDYLSNKNIENNTDNDINLDSAILTEETGKGDLTEQINEIEAIEEIEEIDEIDEIRGIEKIEKIKKFEADDDNIPENNGGGTSETYTAVLYEDSSNIIDYVNRNSRIDSTLAEYNKIKRIGTGNLEIKEDGINFRTGKKFFRFEFYRLADIKSGDDFIAFLVKGSSVSRLFLFKKNTAASTRLEHFYNNYTANVL